MIRFAVFSVPLMLAAPAVAQVAITLPLDADARVESVRYVCGGADQTPFTVQYVNAGADHLAVIPLGQDARIFVNVIAASGARYVAGEYEWWVKGDSATLTNQMDAAASRDCKVTD